MPNTRDTPGRWTWAAAAGLLVAAGAAIAVGIGAHRSKSPGSSAERASHSGPGTALATEDEAVSRQVAAFCGDCHAVPSPQGFPEEAWRAEVEQGYRLYEDSGRNDLEVPSFEPVLEYFASRAPKEIVLEETPSRPSPVAFEPIASASRSDPLAAIAHVTFATLQEASEPGLVLCDFRSGEVLSARLGGPRIEFDRLARLANPAHATAADLDGDGRNELLIADLGSFLPADHADGRVLWLEPGPGGSWKPVVLQQGLGRVADVQPGDFDEDGDLDLVVAEFGWRQSGRVLLLENRTEPPGPPKFVLRELDSRHGTIHVPVVDFDRDGHLDFVALISQEHETIEVFLGDGRGNFRRETIYSAGEPAFGSSGIQVVDLDADGDLDVLYTAGDSFDSFHLKPYHGIRWLENRGAYPFAERMLAAMPGVHRALGADLDGDGDLDVAACALLPGHLLATEEGMRCDGVLWLEQTSPGTFARHSLKKGGCSHAAMEVGDFDADGDVDLAVGTLSERSALPSLTIWWNRLREGQVARGP